MRYVVLFKGNEEIFGEFFEEEQIRGLGRVYVYRDGVEVVFLPSIEDIRFRGKEYEEKILESFGKVRGFIGLVYGERVEIYPPGNPTNKNPLLHPSYTPRTLAPADADLLGSLFLSMRAVGMEVDIVAVHDPPVTVTQPFHIISLPPSMIKSVIPPLLAGLRKKKMFIPYMTVSKEYRASYFYSLLKKRFLPLYHIPYYWRHFLDDYLLEEARKKGRVRGILLEKGLELPGELPHKEV